MAGVGAEQLKDLEGPFATAGASAKFGGGIAADWAGGRARDGRLVQTGSLQASVGVNPLLGEIHGGAQFSQVIVVPQPLVNSLAATMPPVGVVVYGTRVINDAFKRLR